MSTVTGAVDWSVLRDLTEQMGDEDIAAMVLDAYRGEIPGRRAALESALTSTPEELRDAVHALKASSLTVGALRLGEMCRQAETLVVSGDLEAARDYGSQALAELDLVSADLEAGPPA